MGTREAELGGAGSDRPHSGARGGLETVPLPDTAAGYGKCQLEFGRVIRRPRATSARQMHARGVARCVGPVFQSEGVSAESRTWALSPDGCVIDLRAAPHGRLLAAPAPFESTLVGSPTARSVVISKTMLPARRSDSAERAARSTRQMLIGGRLRDGRVTTIARRDSLTLLRWDEQRHALELEPKVPRRTRHGACLVSQERPRMARSSRLGRLVGESDRRRS